MPDLIVVCALDPYGAEASGKAYELDTVVQADARIIWAWAGESEPPPLQGIKGRVWSTGSESSRLRVLPEPELAETFVRHQFYDTVAPKIARALKDWNQELDIAGRFPDEKLVHLILAGSFADPRTAVAANAFFAAYCDTESLWGGWRMRGVWAMGRNTGGCELEEKLREAATAVSLFDLSHAIKSRAESLRHEWLPVFPGYLVGNGSRLADLLPTRSDAALLGALAILGSIHDIRKRLSRESIFAVRHEEDTRATMVGKSSFSAGHPFAGIGGSVIRKRRDLLLRACATVLLRGLLAQFRRQPLPEPGFGPDVIGGGLQNSLDEWSRNCLADSSRELSRRGFRQSGEYAAPLSVQAVRQTIGWEAFNATFSERIETMFGWSTFANRPLELWDQSLQELDVAADRFFFADRQLLLRQFLGAAIESVDAAIRTRVDRICIESQRKDSPLPFQPHVLSRAFVREARLEIDSLAVKDRESRLGERKALCSEDELPAMESRISSRLAELRKLVRLIPSPLAIFVRLIVLFAVSLFGFGISEFPYYAQFTGQQVGLLRVGQALTVTLVVGFWLLRRAFLLKADLRKAFVQWFQLKLDFCRERHLRFELAIREELFAALGEYFKWVESAPASGSPAPFHEFSHLSREIARTWPFHRTPLATRTLQKFLHSYPEMLREAADRCDAHLDGIVGEFTACRREFLLPILQRGKEGARKLYRVTGSEFQNLAEYPDRAEEEALRLVAAIFESHIAVPDLPALLFCRGERKGANVAWSGSHGFLPFVDQDPAHGEPIEVRAIATLAEYLRIHPGKLEKSLTQWLLEDVFESTSWASVNSIHPPTWRLIDEAKTPPLSVEPSRAAPRLEIWSPGDSHFTDSFDPNKSALRYDMKVDQDSERSFYALVALLPELSGEEIVFGAGGPDSPDNLIGLRFQKAMKMQEPAKVLTPLHGHG